MCPFCCNHIVTLLSSTVIRPSLSFCWVANSACDLQHSLVILDTWLVTTHCTGQNTHNPCAKLHFLYLKTTIQSRCRNCLIYEVILIMANLTFLFRFLYVGFVRNRQGRLTEWCPTYDKGRSELCYNKLVYMWVLSMLVQQVVNMETTIISC